MLLNDLNANTSRKLTKINKVLREHFGFSLASEIETGKLNRLYTKIADDLYNLKLDLSNVKSKDYAQKLLVSEGLKIMLENRKQEVENLKEAHLVGPGARRYEAALNAASADVEHACSVGDDYEDAIRDAMKDYRSSELRFPDQMFEFDLREMTANCTLDSQIAQYEGEPLAMGDEMFESEDLEEKAPPGMEDWIMDRKEDFKKQYGDRWQEVLYATAWDRYNKNEAVEEGKIGDLVGKELGQYVMHHPMAKVGRFARKHIPGQKKAQAKARADSDEYLKNWHEPYMDSARKQGNKEWEADLQRDMDMYDRSAKRLNRIAKGKKPFSREGMDEIQEDAGHSILDVITPEELEELRSYFSGANDPMDFIGSSVYEKLFEYYLNSGDMPYGVAKARTGDPDQWILDRVEQDYGDEVLPMEEGRDQAKGRAAEQDWLKGITARKAKKGQSSGNDYYSYEKEPSNRKRNMKEGYVKQLRKLLEAEVEQAESLIAARGFSQELQDMIEKLGRLVNEDLPAVSEQMRDAYGADVATGFENTVSETLGSVMDSLKGSKQDIDNSVTAIADGQAPEAGSEMGDMDFDDEELGDEEFGDEEMGDELGGDDELDLDMDDDDLDLDSDDELLGRAKKESVSRRNQLKRQITEMQQKLRKLKSQKAK